VTLEAAGFWGLAAILLGSSLAVVLARNLFHSVLYLAIALVATGGIFLLLDAAFLFGVQLLLYAGGVVTIVVFAIMLTERLVGERIQQTSRRLGAGAVAAVAVFGGIFAALGRASLPVARPALPANLTAALGAALVTRYVVALELLALLFVAALIGALYIARADD
jgi:NADH:ubiquinone oxidoreductase subunit 6 (subunit J)